MNRAFLAADWQSNAHTIRVLEELRDILNRRMLQVLEFKTAARALDMEKSAERFAEMASIYGVCIDDIAVMIQREQGAFQ